VFHHAVYYGVCTVFTTWVTVFLFYSVVLAQGAYGLWSCFGWSCIMFEMALKNLETSSVFMRYSIIRGKGEVL